MPLRLLRY